MEAGVYIEIFPSKKIVILVDKDDEVTISENIYGDIVIEYNLKNKSIMEKIEKHFKEFNIPYGKEDNKIRVVDEFGFLSVKNFKDMAKRVMRSKRYLKFLLTELIPI